MDAAWVYDDVEDAVDFVNSIPDVALGWFEDVFPPGDAGNCLNHEALSSDQNSTPPS